MNLKYSFLLTLLILPCFTASEDILYPQEFEEKADSLIDLTETNFDQNVFSGDNDRWFVMFYARWCPHCQDATSLFNELAKALDGKVKIGRVDCDANPGLRDRYSIQGIPTFLYFYQGEIHQYEGDRTVEAWSQFANEGFKKTENKKPEDIKTVEDETHSLVDQNQENSEDIIRNPGLVIELTDKNFDSQVNNGERWFERWFVMFYVPWCPHSQNSMPAFDELANSLQNQLNFGKVDCDTEDALREKYSIQAYPTFLYFYKGEIRQYEGDRTVEAWTEFVNSGYQKVGTTEPQEAKAVEENSTPVNSEEIFSQETYLSENQLLENPENITQQAPVQESSLPVNVQWKDDSLIELSDINFNYYVLTGIGKWFIMFYNPLCPVCRETMPTFIQLAKSQQGEVSVGRVDVEANPYVRSRYAIQGHPTFLYFEKKEPSKYEGENTVEAWTEFVKNGGEKKIIEENRTPIAPEEQQPENQYNLTQRPEISQPESIDYLTQQPFAEAVPQLPENVTQQLPVEERPQFKRAENISQPENAENITQQLPDQGRPQSETPVNIPQLPENTENITQYLPNEGVPQPESLENITQQLPVQERPQVERAENITQQFPAQGLPQPESLENITQQLPVEERPQFERAENISQLPENLENITQQFPDQGRPQPETPVNLPQLPENVENITQQLPNEGVPQPGSPENITQQVPAQERPQVERAENITQQFPVQGILQPESLENTTQQLPVEERPQVERAKNISQLPENLENITTKFPDRGIPQPAIPENISMLPENAENITQQLPNQGILQPESPENITQPIPVQERPQPETPVNIPQLPENTENITQQLPNERVPQPQSTENITQQLPIEERPQPESPENITQPIPVQEHLQPETLEALIDLTEANFDSNVHSDENRKWFVMFYTPWCPHCNEAMPTFGELANSLRDQVSVGKVDCDANPGLRDRFSIQAYPIFLYFYKGEIHQYKGPREIEAWTEFATTHYRYTDIQAPDEDKVIERDTTPLNRNESIAAPPQTPEVPEEKTDSLIELCDNDFDSKIFSNVEEKWFVMFYDPSCPRCQEAMPTFGDLANSLNGQVSVARVDCDANPGLAAKYNIQDHPTFLLFYQGETHQYDGLRTIEAWTDFATTDYKSGEVPLPETETVIERDSAPLKLNESVVPPQTPEITEERADSLIDLCDDDFESNVFSQDKEKWFVMFYAPWCPHCEAAMPEFGEFANSLKDQVSVARVDCEANPGLRDKYSIQGYPTFLFFYKGEIHQYEGPRTVEAWTEFVTRDYKSTETQTPEEVKEIEKDSSPIPSEPQHIPQERTPTITAEETDSLIDLNKDNFNTKVFANEDDKWMIMFYAPWCPHCKHAMPAFKELAKVVKGHAKVGRVDCDANPELRTRFAIEGYPTFLFFSDGDVRKFEGARTIEAWSNFVDEGYKKVKAIEENVHEIKEVVHHATKFFELTPAVMIIGGALIGAILLFCFLAITHRKNEDTTIRHAQLENTDVSDDSRIYMD